MQVKYLGGRTVYTITFERKDYHFTLENNRTLDIQDKRVINYIFGLPNKAEFEVVVEEPKPIIIEPKTEKNIAEKPQKSKGGKSNAKKKQ
jgi:hypothetical protein